MEERFDGWAATYDADVQAEPKGFPFAGYEAVLDGLAGIVRGSGARRVLELGIGTGNLAARLVEAAPGVEVWGVDFSAEMLAREGERVPGARLIRAEVDGGLAGLDLPTFGAVVASYVLHELPDDRKLALIRYLFDERLEAGGVVAVGDIAFADEAGRDAVRHAPGVGWDASEHYLVADRFLAELAGIGIVGDFWPVSFCAGVFVLRANGAGDGRRAEPSV